jgi:hypothetical protein
MTEDEVNAQVRQLQAHIQEATTNWSVQVRTLMVAGFETTAGMLNCPSFSTCPG